MHRHTPMHDTQGVIYCGSCREFLGLKGGGVRHYIEDGMEVSEGWGYALNGVAWTKDLLAAIKANGNKYNDRAYELMNQTRGEKDED